MSARISYKKQTALIIMVLLVLLAMLAGIAQIYYFSIPNCNYGANDVSMLGIFERNQLCDDYRQIVHHFAPGYRQYVPDQHLSTVNINDQGFRGPEFSVQKPDNTYRIFFLGGSTAFGYGSTSDATAIPGYLQTMYDARGLPFEVEVINAGIGHAASYTEHMMIKDRLLDMGPDLFIIYDGWNDAGNHPDNPGISNRAHKEIMTGESTLEYTLQTKEERRFFRNLYANLGIALWLVDIRDNILHVNQNDPRIHDNTPIMEKVSIWLDRWNEICAIGNEHGVEVMVTVQPILGSGNYTMSKSEMESYESNNNKILVERLAHYASALPNLDSCAITSDLRGALDGADRPIFYDAGHLNDYGNELVASAIFEESYPVVKRHGSQ